MPNHYTGCRISGLSAEFAASLIPRLVELGFEGFEEGDDWLTAYGPSGQIDRDRIEAFVFREQLKAHIFDEPEQNWNAAWESSFEPVLIPNEVCVRADFHQPVPGIPIDLVITPKMSFGTGHHATTWLMMDYLIHHPPKGLNVLDFGTGTGVLAILAEKLGAAQIRAIDNDPWSITNAQENLQRNQCSRVSLVQANSIPVAEDFGLILANINKSVILSEKDRLVAALASGGSLVLSGLLGEDMEEVVAAFEPKIGKPLYINVKNNWLILAFYQ